MTTTPEPVAALTPLPHPRPASTALKWVGRGLSLIAVLAVLAGGAFAYHLQQEKKPAAEDKDAGPAAKKADNRVKRVGVDELTVPPEVVRSLGVKTAAVKAADRPRTLPPLQGNLNFDPNRLTRVYSRFQGEVVGLGTVDGGETDHPTAEGSHRALRPGDAVAAGQLLAVVWSKDLGDKKSDYVAALSDVKYQRENVDRYKSLNSELVAQKDVRAAEAALRAAENKAIQSEAALRVFRLTEDEITGLAAEAEKLGTPDARREHLRRAMATGKTWARVEVRAPFAGKVLEKNTNVGNVIDTATYLFYVGDVSRLTFLAQAYEDDLPALQSLPKTTRWDVRLPARPDYRWSGTLDVIGEIVDPTQHTVPIQGAVDNASGELRVGQFITATAAVPPQAGEIEVPIAALIEDGKDSVVLVHPDADPASPRYVRRPVVVTRRYGDAAYVRASAAADGLHPGDRVVVGGALQLNQALVDAPAPAVAAAR